MESRRQCLAGINLARQSCNQRLGPFSFTAETQRRGGRQKREVGMPTSWTVGGRLADRFAGRPEYARAKGAEGAEDAEEEGVSRNRRGARGFCTLAGAVAGG